MTATQLLVLDELMSVFHKLRIFHTGPTILKFFFKFFLQRMVAKKRKLTISAERMHNTSNADQCAHTHQPSLATLY